MFNNLFNRKPIAPLPPPKPIVPVKTDTVDSPEYWKERLESSPFRHHAVFYCPLNKWRLIERRHRTILSGKIQNNQSVIDVGCAWGRLLDLLPPNWHGDYLGIDIASSFIDIAMKEHPRHNFVLANWSDVLPDIPAKKFDWAVLISVRPMILRHFGSDVWEELELELERVCTNLLFLEYDVKDPGTVQ